MSQKIITIFCSYKISIGGGPSGYLYNLRSSFKKVPLDIDFIFPSEIPYSIFLRIFRLFASCIPIKHLRHKTRKYIEKLHIASCINSKPSSTFFMCHSCYDLNLVNNLWKNGRIRHNRPRFILMSHSPTLPSTELLEIANYSGKKINFSTLLEEDIKAFSLAEIVVSPSENAMNSYRKEAPNILHSKFMYYITTGCPALRRHDKIMMRKKFHVHTNFVICYVGRHWFIKGYDRLKEIAQQILSIRNDVTFLIAGNPNKAIPPLEHPCWIELGWADSSEVFSCSDIFLLPSRESYFDLVIPEALSTGLKCIVSNAGGNIDFHKICSDIDIFSTNSEAIEKINSFFSLSEIQRSQISEILKIQHNTFFSLDQFAFGYLNFFNSLKNL